MVKSPPASAGNTGDAGLISGSRRRDPPEKEMATTLVFLPEKFHGQRSLVGSSAWDHKKSDSRAAVTLFKNKIKLNIYFF